ncbi:WW domain-containing protein [Fusarium keratoplasticum]|uniref:WW domain-containing protein n=1 Tax=Fusarium keratoplasticum TaxID=1328300 RepID=A0ACC0RE17_9HYPO|nr:WW domain-containing protein [Fusarium keratoplasticum]KAI8680272.1 WW domain-containing protein [Fusarium keratoplasticum]
MLKSTHKPSAAALAPLPPGWTEHTAPTGHTYYYNSETKESTYKRPGTELSPPQPAQPPASAYPAYGSMASLADPNVANAYMAQLNQTQHGGPQSHQRGGHGGGRGGFEGRPRPQPVDKPRRKEAIPGCEPWILVYTKYSRRFVYNPVKNASYWRIPEKLMPAILELDKERLRKKAERLSVEEPEAKRDEKKDEPTAASTTEVPGQENEDDSEYEEVEVTDDEGEGEGEGEGDDGDEDRPSKRQRTEEDAAEDEDEDMPMEFTEADFAAQLQAMGEDYGLEPGDYDDGNAEEWPEGAEGVPFTQDDARALFKDLLNDFNINPYSPWEKLLEEGKIIDDLRYTALSTTKARRECWDEWTRERIAELKEQRARQEKRDPRIALLAFLQEKATPKLYWPEFKRKYKKEEVMKTLKITDKDREKSYREHIGRLKMPQSKLKSDLTALLKAQPIHLLNNKSLSTGLPDAILTDIRYISLEPQVRDPLIEAYVSNLPPPPEDPDAAKDDEEKKKQQEAREKRQKALEDRNRAVEEQRRKRDREVAVSKARLREEERELEMAMNVGKQGLQSQLASMKETEKESS